MHLSHQNMISCGPDTLQIQKWPFSHPIRLPKHNKSCQQSGETHYQSCQCQELQEELLVCQPPGASVNLARKCVGKAYYFEDQKEQSSVARRCRTDCAHAKSMGCEERVQQPMLHALRIMYLPDALLLALRLVVGCVLDSGLSFGILLRFKAHSSSIPGGVHLATSILLSLGVRCCEGIPWV